ncbi:hypothetical protein ACIRVF_22895 [Kitasatospora sp. NPDC101157]
MGLGLGQHRLDVVLVLVAAVLGRLLGCGVLARGAGQVGEGR